MAQVLGPLHPHERQESISCLFVSAWLNLGLGGLWEIYHHMEDMCFSPSFSFPSSNSASKINTQIFKKKKKKDFSIKKIATPGPVLWCSGHGQQPKREMVHNISMVGPLIQLCFSSLCLVNGLWRKLINLYKINNYSTLMVFILFRELRSIFVVPYPLGLGQSSSRHRGLKFEN